MQIIRKFKINSGSSARRCRPWHLSSWDLKNAGKETKKNRLNEKFPDPVSRLPGVSRILNSIYFCIVNCCQLNFNNRYFNKKCTEFKTNFNLLLHLHSCNFDQWHPDL